MRSTTSCTAPVLCHTATRPSALRVLVTNAASTFVTSVRAIVTRMRCRGWRGSDGGFSRRMRSWVHGRHKRRCISWRCRWLSGRYGSRNRCHFITRMEVVRTDAAVDTIIILLTSTRPVVATIISLVAETACTLVASVRAIVTRMRRRSRSGSEGGLRSRSSSWTS